LALVKRMVSLFSALVISFGAIAYAYDPNKGAAYACDAEPVQLVRSLGIMTGHGDGELDLDGILTRAQAAKMIYVARTGTDDKAYLFDMPGMGMFADVPRGYWAAGYINYCAAQGIVSGRGNNTFDPDGYITGFEYMKILLVALGYDAVEEKLANDRDWKLFTVTTAAEPGLTEAFDENPPVSSRGAGPR